jgi:hypothetical protein
LQSDKYNQLYSAVPARNVSPGRADNYIRSYTNRQSRYQTRADRRFNDWFLFGIPSPLLWLEGACLADVGYGIPGREEVIVELWL